MGKNTFFSIEPQGTQGVKDEKLRLSEKTGEKNTL
jgi:hypothetical protein